MILDQKVTKASGVKNARLEYLLDAGRAGPERPARQLNMKHPKYIRGNQQVNVMGVASLDI